LIPVLRQQAFPVPDLFYVLNKLKINEVKEAEFDETAVKSIVTLIEKINKYHFLTFQHSLNVSLLSYLLAAKLKLSHNELVKITLGALLHDIGKIYTPTAILDKPSKLTHTEWELVKLHPKNGMLALTKYPWASNILPIVGQHHEKMDGTGYYGMNRDQISLGAKIISIADAFDAMISARPYQKKRSLKDCFNELKNNSNIQFDSYLVNKFIEIICMEKPFKKYSHH